jgi:hypothetical protein
VRVAAGLEDSYATFVMAKWQARDFLKCFCWCLTLSSHA